MKKIVIYTSATGNTEKVGLAIANELGCEAVKFTEDLHLDLDRYDFVALGFYVDKGDVEPKFKRFLREIKGKKSGRVYDAGHGSRARARDKLPRKGKSRTARGRK